jgi:ABC-2 type transport system ATP-binding protein
MLRVQKLCKTFNTSLFQKSVIAADNISFDVEFGSICGIVGQNGAGKTTTIRMILGILLSDSGSISIDGIDHIDKTIFGYLPEERGLYKKSTVWENLFYLGSLKLKDKSIIKSSINYWLERFDIKEYKNREIAELSKGNQQKIQFIASILHNPKILIVDEPFSGLDPLNQVLFKDILIELKNNGLAIIFCTHQLQTAEEICDSIVMIHQGKLALYGTIEAIKHKYYSDSYNIVFVDTNELQDFIIDKTFEAHLVSSNKVRVSIPDKSIFTELLQKLSHYQSIVSIEKFIPSLLSIYTDIISSKHIN